MRKRTTFVFIVYRLLLAALLLLLLTTGRIDRVIDYPAIAIATAQHRRNFDPSAASPSRLMMPNKWPPCSPCFQ